VAVLEGFSLGYVDETQTMGVRDVQQEFDQEALAEGADGLPTAQQPEAACR
jgi:hypothetical protein